MKYLTSSLLTFILITTTVTNVFAQAAPQGIPGIGRVTPPTEVDRTPQAINNYIPTALTVIFFLALLGDLGYLIYGGIKWIMAGGDQKLLAAARTQLTNAIIGTIFLSIAFVIATLLNNALRTAAPSTQSNPYYGIGFYCDGANYKCPASHLACVQNSCVCGDPKVCGVGPN